MMDPKFASALKARNLVFIFGTGISAAITGNAPTATWRGLIDDGIERANAFGVPMGWADIQRSNLSFGFANGDMTMVLGVANAVSSALQRDDGYAYTKWLQDSVGDLRTKHVELIAAIHRLPFPIFTTNYDTLIEGGRRSSANWTNPASMQAVLAGSTNDVGHLHGVWNQPASVIFSDAKYQELLASSSAQAIQSAASTVKSLVYVGFGAGLDDPNFSRLIQWHKAAFAPSGVDHFRLCLDEELDALTSNHSGDHIRPIAYGKAHEDLATFLDSLLSTDVPIVLTPAGIAKDVVAETQQNFLLNIKNESIIADTLEVGDECDISEIVLAPVLLPVPQADYVKSRIARDPVSRVERLDPSGEVKHADVLIIAAEENSGLTTAVKWLALEGARYLGAAIPIYVSFQSCRKGPKPLVQQIRHEALSQGVLANRDDPLPPYVLALDDFSPYVEKISERVLVELSESPAVLTVIGCAYGAEDELLDRLQKLGLSPKIRYLGKLSASDIRDLAKLASPANFVELAKQVTDVVTNENLPRTPFTVALLMSVLLRGGTLSKNASQTSILDDYVGLLLGRGDPHDDARFGLDQNTREAILSGLAQSLVESDAGGLAEEAVIASFQQTFDKFAWDESPTHALASFLERRVLRRNGRHIQFSRSSFLHLFAAKRATADGAFRSKLLSRPLYYSPALTDYAAIYRHDGELLAELRLLLKDGEWDGSKGGVFAEVGMTTPIKIKPLPASPRVTEDAQSPESEDDEYFDSTTDLDSPPFPTSDEHAVPPGLQLMRTLELVSAVLRDSDQIEDLDLKKAVLLETLTHWSVMMSVINRDRSFRDMIEHMVEEFGPTAGTREDKYEEIIDELVKAIPASIALGGITLTLASRKLTVLLDRAILDTSIGDTEESVVGAVFFLFGLGEPGWVAKVAALLETHVNIWIVRNYLLHLLLRKYYDDKVAPSEKDALLELCMDIIQRTTRYDDSQRKADHRDALKKEFEQNRIKNLMRSRGTSSEPLD